MCFCGIGNPDSFEKMVIGLGATVADRRIFQIHYAYERKDVVDLASWIGESGARRRCHDSKDAVKLRLSELGNVPLWALRLSRL